jgi:hypothetical protein
MSEEKQATPREVLNDFFRRGIRVTTDGVALELQSVNAIAPSDIEVVRTRKVELIAECKERDFELCAVWRRYNRTLRRFDDAVRRLVTPEHRDPSEIEALHMILNLISEMLEKTHVAGYLPSREEILNGFIIPVEG